VAGDPVELDAAVIEGAVGLEQPNLRVERRVHVGYELGDVLGHLECRALLLDAMERKVVSVDRFVLDAKQRGLVPGLAESCREVVGGSASVNPQGSAANPRTPLVCGYCPVNSEARLGEHCGIVVKTFENPYPSPANPSIAGVSTVSTP
jgi:hypothetical protein